MAKKIAVLGSTGSIGISTLNIIQAHPGEFELVALGAGKNIDLLLQQIHQWRPKAVALKDSATAKMLKNRLSKDESPEILFGQDGFIRLATLDHVDTVVSAITGAAGLMPTYEAIKAGKEIALANKETMVMAGQLIMGEAKSRGISILPIDSEHSAILQCLCGHPRSDVKRIILTASGGPFLKNSIEQMKQVTPSQALNHPNWDMGPKVTIDSATLMNKGLEAIEAKWFFDLDMKQISILIHPQSIVHSMVEYCDGSVIAQLGIPDMTIPISYALSYPRHLSNHLPELDLVTAGPLYFEEPDIEKFRCLKLALRAAEIGGTMPAVLNAANEIAVEAFLDGRIGFLQIPRLIESTMEAHTSLDIEDINTVLEADSWARDKASTILQKKQI